MIELLESLGKKDAYVVLKIIKKLGKARYVDIEKEIVSLGYYITSPTLSRRLKELRSSGLITKNYDESEDDVVYMLTPFGEEVVTKLEELELIYKKFREGSVVA